MAECTLTMIGTGSALSMHGRHPSAQYLRFGDTGILIDCGEGTLERMKSAGVKPFSIHFILISHLHGDHVYGLPGLLSTLSHLRRECPLTVIGPVGMRGFLEEVMKYTFLQLHFPLTIIEKAPTLPVAVAETEEIEILTFPLVHRVPCNGYLVREKASQVRLRKDRVEALKLSPEQIQTVLRGEDVLIGDQQIPATDLIHSENQAMSYAYCSDTEFERRLGSWLRGVEVLYHEATFMNDMQEMAQTTGHSTGADAGRVAQAAGVKCLITGHFSSRYKKVEPVADEARQHFRHVIAAEEGKRYNLRNLVKGLIT